MAEPEPQENSPPPQGESKLHAEDEPCNCRGVCIVNPGAWVLG